jgi:hypothetical protein
VQAAQEKNNVPGKGNRAPEQRDGAEKARSAFRLRVWTLVGREKRLRRTRPLQTLNLCF